MTLRLRVLPRFPARISGINGISTYRDGPDLVIESDYGALVRIPAVANEATTFFKVWKADDDSYSIMTFEDVFAAVVDIAGLMAVSVYDPTAKNQDIFAYAVAQAASKVPLDGSVAMTSNLDLGSHGLLHATGLNGGAFSGFRNLLLNARYSVNQPAAAASGSLAANAHWYDGWRAGPGGCTFSLAGGVLTITSGAMVQNISGGDIETGTHVINWAGTAACTVAGVATAKGGNFTLTRGTNAAISFSGGTVSFAQVEPGDTPTVFERRPLSVEFDLAKWRYEQIFLGVNGYQSVSGEIQSDVGYFHEKISTPTATLVSVVAGNMNAASASYDNLRTNSVRLVVTGAAIGAGPVIYATITAIDARI